MAPPDNGIQTCLIMFISKRPVKRQGAQIWASRGNFLNNETDGASSVDILKTSECKKENLRSISPSTDEAVAVNNNNDYEKSKYSDVKSLAASKRLSDSIIKSPLIATLTRPITQLCGDEIDNILHIVGGQVGLSKATSKDSGIEQSPENVTCNTSLSSNCEQLPHDIALDESGFTVDTSLGDSSIEDKSISSCTPSPISPMSPETEFIGLNMSEDREEKSFENGEIMNPRSPFHLNLEGCGNFPLVQMVCRELLVTERSYVNDLKEIIEGYIYHLKKNYSNEDIDVFDIFGNLEDIYEFNKEVLYQIEQCEVNENEIDPIKLANVFCEKTSGFNTHYTQYCTEYPEAASALSYLMQDQDVANFFLERQSSIGHALSLESYLLKPVQRILKYNLLLKDILKKYRGDEDGYNIINTALDAMSDVAEYINEMKRLHENARQVDEILNNIVDIDEPVNRYATGKFVLENTFKIHGMRGDRTIILFEKLLIMVKKTEDKQLQFKDRIECSNMMLVESMPKEPLGFQLLRFDNQKDTYTIVAKTPEIKKEWTQHLKRLILENHAAKIPQTARQAILGEEQAKSKYNSLPMQALDNTGMNTLRKPTPKGSKSPNIKDNVSVVTGVKRESNEKDTSKEPKRHLRPKDFLNEKKGRSSVTSPTGVMTAEKEKKEKLRWIRRHKHKPSLDSVLNMDTNTEEDNNDYIPQDTMIKSRSLESLKDVLKLQEDIEFKPEEESRDTAGSPECISESDVETNGKNNNSLRHRSKSATNGPTHYRSSGVGDYITEENENTEVSGTPKESNYITEPRTPDIRCESVTIDKEVINEPPLTEPARVGVTGDKLPNETLISSLNDVSNSHSHIKKLVNKVNNALHNSFHSGNSTTDPNVSSNDTAPMFFSPTETCTTCDKGRDMTQNTDVSIESCVDRISHDISVFNESDSHDDNTSLNPINSESESDTITTVDELLPPKSDNCELTDSDDNTWSTNVDALFYEVNADLDSIAGSIASDTAKSNESGSDVNNTPTDSSTSIGIDVAEKVGEAERQVTEIDELVTPTENVSQVKQVADRIKEFKRLVDAEKRRHSWTQREPRSIHEMIESLDSIQSVDNAISPTYSSLRRRFRPSRDYSAGRDVRSSLEIRNETPRTASPSRVKSFDSCVHDLSFVESNTKCRESLSQMQPVGSPRLDATFESDEKHNVASISSSDISEGNSGSYEYIEASLKTPDLVSTADLVTSLSPKPGDEHLLHERNSLDNVFYEEFDEKLTRAEKSKSLPAAISRKEAKDKSERKTSDTTILDKTPIQSELPIDLLAYTNLLSEGGNVAKRTEVYFRALKNFEQHKRKPAIQKPKTPSFTTCDFSPLICYDKLSNTRISDETIQRLSAKESDVPNITNQIETKKDDDRTLNTSSTRNSEILGKCEDGDIEKSIASCIHNLEQTYEEDVSWKLNEFRQEHNDEHKEYNTDDIEDIKSFKENIIEQLEENAEDKTSNLRKGVDENNNDKNKHIHVVCQNENPNDLRIESDENNNEKNKVFHMGNERTKVFHIGMEGSLNEKKVFRMEKQKMKPYQLKNIEKRQPNENIEKIKLCRIGGDDKTLKCRLNIIEKTKVLRQDDKISRRNENKSESDNIRIPQQNSNSKIELYYENNNSTSNSIKCQSLHESELNKLSSPQSCEPLNSRRSKSAPLVPLGGGQAPRPQSRFTTETFINLDKRSLKKSNSTPPDTFNIIIPPFLQKENSDESNVKDNDEKLRSRINDEKMRSKINNTLTHKKAPDIYQRTPPISKRVTRSCSMPSVNGVSACDKRDKEQTRVKREQIDQLKSKLDSCVVEESRRGRSKSAKNCSDDTPMYQRSTSLPRRKTNFLVLPNKDVEDTKKTEKYVLRSPSIRNIQQNHVNNRIKDYFVNLQKSSEISRSRPNLLLVDNNSSSGSDSECSTEENDNLPLTDNTSEDNVQIYRGTVHSMIKKYGQVNFVFD